MALGEFDLIRRYFAQPGIRHPETRLGIGDDCALLSCPPGMELAITVDTLVADIHFFADVAPDNLGHKALAVNLSDLAAMGAQPKWCTLPDVTGGSRNLDRRLHARLPGARRTPWRAVDRR